jgi:phosphatidate cytidylyltransferase
MAESANKNLAIRFASAGVGGPLILGILYFAPPWAWFAFLFLATGVGAWELFEMGFPDDVGARVVGVLMTLGVSAVVWFLGHDPRYWLAMGLAVPLLSQLLVLWRLGEIPTAALRVTTTTFGTIWLGVGMAAMAVLRRDAGADGPGFVVLALMLSWLSDTGAYFAGRFLGKAKLYPAVSPKKTRAGAFGGLGGAIVGALLAHFFYLKSLPLVDGLVLAVVAGAIGQAGDLGESLLKRSFGVKDSGGIVPGHGGILDRIDALLVTSGFCCLYVLFVRA